MNTATVGAGVGTWTTNYLQYVQALAALPMGFVDMHIYPLGGSDFTNALTAAQTIEAAGKQVGISEFWDMKTTSTSLTGLNLNTIYGLDPFSFWYPLDISFLQAVVNFANYKQLAFLSPYWMIYFFSYLDYNTYGSLPAATVLTDEYSLSALANEEGLFTPTGHAWETMNLPADTTAPNTPAAPTAVTIGATSITFAWPTDYDNVGVSAYNIYRYGTLLASTDLTLYEDVGLSPGTNYYYTITASDASGNVSPMSAPLIVQTLPCSLGDTSVTVGSGAGSGSVLLLCTASYTWSAGSNASWLQLSAGSTGGTGNALIQFTYNANSNTTPQTGTLTIGGLTFTVTQAGAGFVPVTVLTPLVTSGENAPQGVAVDALGSVFIADTGNNAIEKWTASTQQLTTLVSTGLNYPTGVALDVDDDVYIADQKNNAIKEYGEFTAEVMPLVSTGLENPVGVAVDTHENVYFSDAGHNVIDVWNPVTMAVTPVVSSGISSPLGVAVDGAGNLYFADAGHNAVKKWTASTNLVSTLVSSGLRVPFGVAVDGQGNVYFADSGNNAIKEWSPATGAVTVLVSTGLKVPTGVAVDGQGNVYVADSGNNAIKEYSPVFFSLGATSRNEGAAAGTDSVSFQVLPASTVVTASSNQSWLTITGSSAGAISFSFLANTSLSSRSALITVLGQTVTVTQNADAPATITKSAGDGQTAAAGQPFATPLQVSVTDVNSIPLQGAAVTFTVVPGAGGASGTFASSPPMPILTNASGIATAPTLTANVYGGTFTVTATVNALNASFTLTNVVYSSLGASSVAVGALAGSGSVLLVSDGAWTAGSNASWLQLSPGSSSGIGNASIQFTYRANPNSTSQTGTLTIAGLTYTVTQPGSNYVPVAALTPLVSSGLSGPRGVAVDTSGNVYIADSGNNAIKEWSAGTQLISTLVSSGLNNPSGVAVDSQGNVYIADQGNHAIEEFKIAGQQLITLVSGLGTPSGVAVDGQGNVYFSDSSNNMIEEWNATSQQVTTLAGSGLNNPTGIAVDAQGNVYFTDSANQSIKEWVAATGMVSVLVSSGLSNPTGVAVDGEGNVYFNDTGNNAIKEWSPVSGQVAVLISMGLNSPYGVAVDLRGDAFVADTSNQAIKEIVNAFVSPASLTEAPSAGSDALLPVFPSSTSLAGIFAPTSDQSWLTIGTVANGVVNFSFTANTSTSARVAHVIVLGKQIPVTQNGLLTQTITFGPLSNQTYGAAPFAVSATASSALAVSFNSQTVGVCTVSGTTVTLLSAGQCTIQATQGGNAAYAAATPVNQTFQVTQASQTITFGALPNKRYGNPAFQVSATASSGLAVSFASTTSTICTVSGTTVTLVGVGTCTIQATQAGNTDWSAAAPVNQSFSVGRATQTITFGTLSNKTYGTAPFALTATASSGLAVSYASTQSVCTVSGNTVTLVATGTCSIQASQAGNALYMAATSVNQSFQVTQGSQTINFGALANKTYGQAAFTVSATASSGLTVSFASTTATVCTVSGTAVTLAGVGTCTIQATQAGNSDWTAATPVNQSFTVSKGAQTITFGTLSNQTYGTAPFALTATASSGLAVSYVSTQRVCTVSGNIVTLVTTGTCSIQASQAGNADYLAATSVNQSFQVTQGSQTITFGTLPNKRYGNPAFTVSATASSGLAVSFASTTGTICAVSGTTVTLVGVGTCTIQATQAGNSDWTAATPVSQSFTVGRGTQTITFGTLPNQTLGAAPFALTATASSGLTVSYVSTESVCTVSGNIVTLVAAGTCSIQASQAGNADYMAATPVDQSFQVLP